MASFNKVFLIGNLTRDPESPSENVTKFGIAVNRKYKKANGDLVEEVNFFNIVVFGKSAENCAKYLAKGRSVHIEGRLHNNSWTTDDGTKRTATEIVADSVTFLGGQQQEQAGGGSEDGDDSDVPY